MYMGKIGQGRPRVISDSVIKKICDATLIGATQQIAALYAGVSEPSVNGWLRKGREERDRIALGGEPDPDKAIYLSFLRRYEKADARALIGWLQVIDASAQNDPHWAFLMLERRNRAYAARQEQTNLELDLSKLSDEQLTRLKNGDDILSVLANKD
jgi:hypothetical protein